MSASLSTDDTVGCCSVIGGSVVGGGVGVTGVINVAPAVFKIAPTNALVGYLMTPFAPFAVPLESLTKAS